MIENLNLNYKKIGLIYFIYTATVAVLIQLVILPYLLPNLHAGNGFLQQLDCRTFHAAAVATAKAIKTHGWLAWEARPEDFGSAGIAAAIYALSVPKLWAMIPVNALVHALSGLIIIALLNRVVNNFVISVSCSLPFILFPSAATWYAQLHQDGFTILGWLLLFYAWTQVFAFKVDEKNIFSKSIVQIFFCISFGYYLIWSMRPYHIRFYSALSIPFYLFALIYFIKRSFRAPKIYWQQFVIILMILVLSQGMKFFVDGYRVWWDVLPGHESENTVSTYEGIMYSAGEKDGEVAAAGRDIFWAKQGSIFGAKQGSIFGAKQESIFGAKQESIFGAKQESIFGAKQGSISDKNELSLNMDYDFSQPEELQDSGSSAYFLVKKLVRELSLNRAMFVSYAMYSGAASNIDLEVSIDSVSELFAYIPRAYQIAFFAPFPNSWSQAGSSEPNTMMRKISVFEMIVVYIGLLGLPLVIYYYYKNIILWILILSNMIIILPMVISIPNVGTIYRMRYGFLMIIVAFGFCGLFSFYNRILSKRSATTGSLC